MRHDATNPGLLLRSIPAVLALIALVLSVYLLVLSFTDGGSPLGCGNESALDCSHVLNSRWSKWLGMPVSLPSAMLYLGIAVLAPLAGPRLSPSLRKASWAALVVMATIAIGGSLWFLGLQLFAIEGICIYCLAIHSSGMLAACFLFVLAPIQFTRDADDLAHHPRALAMASLEDSVVSEPVVRVTLDLKDFAGVLIAGIAAVGLFLVTQIASLPEEQTYVVETYENVELPSSDLNEEPADLALPESDDSNRPIELNGFDASAELESGTSQENPQPPPSSEDSPKASEASRAPDQSLFEEPAQEKKEPRTGESPLLEAPLKQSDPKDKPSIRDEPGKSAVDSLLNDAFFSRESNDTGNPFPPKSEVTPPEGKLRILGGKATIHYDQVMYLGRADAPYVIVKMFDYTCSHCRSMHGYLEVARRRYGGQLGIVLIPVPLNRQCNPTVRSTAPQHKNACDYAKVALGVWKHRREEFAAFHSWLFAPSNPPSPGTVKRRAVQILGEEILQDLDVDLSIARQLNQGVELYQTMGTGTIPKVIMGDGVLSGIVKDSSQLFKELETHLKITPIRTE